MAKATITNIGLQIGTTRTVFVTWDWSKRSQTDKYDVRWYYGTGNGIRFIGSEQEVTITNAQLQSTYTPPDNAYVVKFQVRPIAKTRKVNGKDVAYWTADWSTEAAYYFSASPNPPITPTTPSVSVSQYTLTASLSNLNVNATEIQFQVVKNDTAVFNTGIAKITTGAASYSCSISAGSKYKVRCRSKKGKDYSSWSEYSENIETIPSAVTSINNYYASSDTSVFLAWTAVSTAKTYDIEYAIRSDYLGSSNASTVINSVTAAQYTITGLTTGEKYYFRVRAVNGQGESGWSKPVSVALGKAPSAPTTWSSTTTAVVGERIILYWTHNTEDGSKEKYAEVETYIDGAKYVNRVENTSDKEEISQYVIDTSNGTVYKDGAVIQWRVRTAGITGAYGEWSAQRTINVYAPATLELHITDNSGDDIETLTSFPLYIKGTAGPSTQSPIGYHVSIIANDAYETVDMVGNVKMVSVGDEVYSKFYDTTNVLTLELTAGSVDLQNNISYTVNCIVTMNTGLSAQTNDIFTVAWTDAEYEVNAEIAYDPKTLAAYIRPYCEDGDVTLSVYRREYDGSFVEIGKNIPGNGNTFITDPHPSLDFARYRIVAMSNSTGAVSYDDVPGYPVGEKAIIIQWDEVWRNFDALGEDQQEEPTWSGSMLRLPYNIDISDSNSIDVTLAEYIGRSHPVSYYGTQVGSTATWNVDIEKRDKETLYALRRLAMWMGDVYVREPSGSGYWANISVSFSQKHCELVIPVTLSLTRVEGGV